MNQQTKGEPVKRRKQVIGAVLGAAAIALASVAMGAGSAGAQSSVRGVTDSEIKVSGLGFAAYYESGGQAAKALFEQVNKAGGIAGRKITYTGWADDKTTADVNLSEGRRLIDQEKVFAIVPAITPYLQVGAYANQTKTPVMGWGISAPYCDAGNKYVIGFTGCLVPNPATHPGNTWGGLVTDQLKSEGKSIKGSTAAVISENNDSGKSGLDVISATALASGQKITYGQASVPAPPATVTDYTPFVQAIMTSNGGKAPDVVYLVLSQNNVFGLGKALFQAGFKGIQTNAVGYAPQLTALANGWTAFTQFATPESTDPNMVKIISTITAGGIAKADIGQATLAGYFAADQFVQILKKVGKNLTPETYQKAAAKFKYQVPNVIGPTYYPAGFKAGSPCGELVTSNGTAWTITAPFKCYDVLTKKGSKWVPTPYPASVK